MRTRARLSTTREPTSASSRRKPSRRLCLGSRVAPSLFFSSVCVILCCRLLVLLAWLLEQARESVGGFGGLGTTVMNQIQVLSFWPLSYLGAVDEVREGSATLRNCLLLCFLEPRLRRTTGAQRGRSGAKDSKQDARGHSDYHRRCAPTSEIGATDFAPSGAAILPTIGSAPGPSVRVSHGVAAGSSPRPSPRGRTIPPLVHQAHAPLRPLVPLSVTFINRSPVARAQPTRLAPGLSQSYFGTLPAAQARVAAKRSHHPVWYICQHLWYCHQSKAFSQFDQQRVGKVGIPLGSYDLVGVTQRSPDRDGHALTSFLPSAPTVGSSRAIVCGRLGSGGDAREP